NYQAKVLGIGIGLPGNLDSNHGVCIFSPNFKWRNVPIAHVIERYFALDCFIINDVNAMTMGEKYFGE
ncbi:MAG: ROK family protein, partial [Armatimonadetes bacterium]|nr:ROK family protein [Armatimonadota bacterium]